MESNAGVSLGKTCISWSAKALDRGGIPSSGCCVGRIREMMCKPSYLCWWSLFNKPECRCVLQISAQIRSAHVQPWVGKMVRSNSSSTGDADGRGPSMAVLLASGKQRYHELFRNFNFFFFGHCFIVSCGSFSNWEKVFGFLNFFSLWRTAYLMHSEMVIQLSWYLRMFMAVLISDNQGIMVLSSEPPLRRLIPQMWLSSAKSWIKKCSVEFCP